jgi:hypothetical protein
VSGRTLVRLAGDARPHLESVRRFDPGASAEGSLMTLRLRDADAETPALVRTLVAANADIVEVRPELAALEDVYLRLVGEQKQAGGRS